MPGGAFLCGKIKGSQPSAAPTGSLLILEIRGRHNQCRSCRRLRSFDRSHALRGNAARDALRPRSRRRASREAFPRRAWERSAAQPIIIDQRRQPFPTVTRRHLRNRMCNRPPRSGALGNASPRFRASKPPVKNKTQRCACRIRRVCE